MSHLVGKKIGAVYIALFFFAENAVLSYSAEGNYWSERRKSSQNTQKIHRDIQLARLSPRPSEDVLKVITAVPVQSISSGFNEGVSFPHSKEIATVLESVPTAYGTVRKLSLPTGQSNGKTIFHIQDVHQNSDAQNNISRALQQLIKDEKIQLIALEGAFEPLNVERFRQFSHRDTVQTVADYFLDENKISGPIHAAFVSAKPMPPILGVDDPVRHRANVEAYRQSIPKQEELKRFVADRKKEMRSEKKRVFNPNLFQFDETVEAYQEGRLALGQYAKNLIHHGPPHPKFNAVRDFTTALGMEKSMDFKQVEIDRKRLVQRLIEKLSPPETQRLLALGSAYRMGHVRYGDFYRELSKLCVSKGVSLSDLKEMDAYIRYVLLSDAIDPEVLFEELNQLEKDAFATLAVAASEKQMVNRSRYLNVMGKLVNFSLTPMDWAEYLALKDDGQTFMEGRSFDLISFEAFYSEAQARDRAMSDNLIKTAARTSVLVTGGFHSSGMAPRLTKAGFTVVSFVPKIEKIETEKGSAYLGVFSREKTPLEKLFQGEKLFLAHSPADSATQNSAAVSVIGVEELKEPGVPLGPLAQTYARALELKTSVSSRDGPLGAEVDVSSERGTVRTFIQKEKGGISVREEIINRFFSRSMRENVPQLIKEFLFFLPALAVFFSTVLMDPTGLISSQLISLGQWRALVTLLVTFPFFLLYHRKILMEINQLLREADQHSISPTTYYFWVSLGFILVGVVALEAAGVTLTVLPALWEGFSGGLIPFVAGSLFSSFVVGGIITHGLFNQFSPFPAMARRTGKGEKKEPALVHHDLAQKFSGVDLEHFVHAQNLLITRALTAKAEDELRRQLNLPEDLQGEEFLRRIYRELFHANNTQSLVDAIIQDSYTDPRLAIEIVGQNPNPQAQSVFEAVANSLDALGFTIGQFGKGVKQIIDWLEPTGEDWLDVWTGKAGVYSHLRILRGTDRRYYIQIQPLSQEAFRHQTGGTLAHGTVVKVTTKNEIPSTAGDLDDRHRNSQDRLIEGIHQRYAYVPEIQITTRKEGTPANPVNGYAEKVLIVPHAGRLPLADGKKKVDVVFSNHSITIMDNGVGMDPEGLFRMFVPKQGSKHPDPIGNNNLHREMGKIRVVHIDNTEFKNRVSFSRNGAQKIR
jgi:hypothetical protein